MVYTSSSLDFDRYDVREVYCMPCRTLQPAAPSCANPTCGEVFAAYNCSICNLYDSSPFKSIYHCPYCNVCRTGKGLGVDFRHCMRCNACVSTSAFDEHVCIAQNLEGNCPVCAESMKESTDPLRGVRCGHVLHVS